MDLVYTNLGGPITAFVDGTTGTASVVKAGAGTDSVDGLGNLLGIGGYGIWGSDAADTFTIDTGAGGWMQVNGGRGSDRYNITLTGDVRLLFSGSWEDGATSGVNINLATGQILNDGFGNVEALVVTDGDGWLEIEATNRADTITGSARDELFILRGGNDTLNAGDGHDALRYDRGASTSAVAVDLQAGTATGTWEGVAFTHQISGIDEIRGTDYGDTIRGSMVHDRLLGRDGNDLLDGRDGGDRLEGDAGNDTLIGGNGNDTLNGGNGDDRIEVGRSVMGGGDWVIGSAGSDTIVYSNIVADSGWNDLSYADLGAGIAATINGVTNTGSVVKAGGGTDTLVDIARVVDGDSGGFSLFGTDHADSYAITTATNNWMQILGGRGADSYNITLSGGNVRLNFSGSWYDWLGATHALRINVATGTIANDGFGHAETISVTGTDGALEINGTTFADVMTGSSRSEVFITQGGNDTIDGAGGYDRVRYNRDDISTGVNVDLATGIATGASDGVAFRQRLSGIEDVDGSNFADVIRGTAADERFRGRDGHDLLVGNAGGDTLSGGDGADTLNGGTGDDFLFGGDSAADLRDVIYGGDGADSIDGGYGNDEAYGGNGHDMMSGDFGADTLIGNDGDDNLLGGALSDVLFGNAGADTLNGGFGHDRLNGGAGADRFFHVGVAGHGSDWIQDYSAVAGDLLVTGQAGAMRSQFQVNITHTPGAGAAGVQEAFVIYRPTGQILWALVDGAGQDSINIQIGGQVFDLLA